MTDRTTALRHRANTDDDALLASAFWLTPDLADDIDASPGARAAMQRIRVSIPCAAALAGEMARADRAYESALAELRAERAAPRKTPGPGPSAFQRLQAIDARRHRIVAAGSAAARRELHRWHEPPARPRRTRPVRRAARPIGCRRRVTRPTVTTGDPDPAEPPRRSARARAVADRARAARAGGGL